jgi:ADP-ribosyl-[dinitrogen reductase] hydrolase
MFPARRATLRVLTDDDQNSELDAVLTDVLDDIEALRADGRQVLVHCFAGQSRTGLVLGAWLRRSQGLSAGAAIDVVGRRWPHLSLWNESFTHALERVH